MMANRVGSTVPFYTARERMSYSTVQLPGYHPLPTCPAKVSARLVRITYLYFCLTNIGWDAPYWNRILTIGEFKHRKTGRQLIVMNTHLDDQGVVARRKSAELIVDRANTLLRTGKYEGVLLTGDFNSEAQEDAYKTIQIGEESPFVDVATYFKVGEARRHGHIDTFTVSG